MLKLVNGFTEDIKNLCSRDPFGTRIAGYFGTYGSNFDFCKTWVQYDENGSSTAAVCDMSGDVTVCASGEADFDELAAFMSMSDYRSLQCQKSVMGKLGILPDVSGYVLSFSSGEYSDEDITNDVDFKEIYDIIKQTGLMGVGDYLPWLSDVTYRVNHGTALAAAVRKDGKTVSCAMALFITENAALLGAVATKDEYRGRGYAGRLVKYLGNLMLGQNKKTYLLCKHGSITEFYKPLGFDITDEWSAVIREER